MLLQPFSKQFAILFVGIDKAHVADNLSSCISNTVEHLEIVVCTARTAVQQQQG